MNLIKKLEQQFKPLDASLLFVQNTDGWYHRVDVQGYLKDIGINVVEGSPLDLRVHFELNFKSESYRSQYTITIYLVSNISEVLEDMRQEGTWVEAGIKDLFPAYPVDGIVDAPLAFLNQLMEEPTFHWISGMDVKERLTQWQLTQQRRLLQPDDEWATWIEGTNIEWRKAIRPISKLLLTSMEERRGWKEQIEQINYAFQESFSPDFFRSLPSRSHLNGPQVVSHVLPYLRDSFPREKVLLLVIDGMAYWQYLLVENQLNSDGLRAMDRTIFAWLPSITRLSRQAIFRGDFPEESYRQNPQEEAKLWRAFWRRETRFKDMQTPYLKAGKGLPSPLSAWEKVAYVDTGLDDKMHSSTEFLDLYSLTQNWISRQSDLWLTVKSYLKQGFNVFMTTDHGNVEATSWRSLTQKEKLGTRQLGSRSERHLNYPSPSDVSMFLSQNPELTRSIGKLDSYLYFKDDKSFSSKASHVTHGGSHFLEVLIPFAQIIHE